MSDSKRINTHFVETSSKDYIRGLINSYNNGDALVRELSERDYGIDLLVEIFENGIPTGKIAFLQIKGTCNDFYRIKNGDISCTKVSESSLIYAQQKRIPFFLVYVSIKTPKQFVYILLQTKDIKNLLLKTKKNKNKNTTVRIPQISISYETATKLIKEINDFYIRN